MVGCRRQGQGQKTAGGAGRGIPAAGRQMPAELGEHANIKRFNEIKAAEQEREVFAELENWMFLPAPNHLDAPRASIRAVATPEPENKPTLTRSRWSSSCAGRARVIAKNPFPISWTSRCARRTSRNCRTDWEFIEWITDHYADEVNGDDDLHLTGQQLLQWLAHWGDESRLQPGVDDAQLHFHGQLVELVPAKKMASRLPGASTPPARRARGGANAGHVLCRPPHAGAGGRQLLLFAQSPPAKQLAKWIADPTSAPAKAKSSAKTQKVAPEMATLVAVATPKLRNPTPACIN